MYTLFFVKPAILGSRRLVPPGVTGVIRLLILVQSKKIFCSSFRPVKINGIYVAVISRRIIVDIRRPQGTPAHIPPPGVKEFFCHIIFFDRVFIGKIEFII